jgi:hypothetical protein
MRGESSACCQWSTNEKRDTLVSVGILALGVGLFVLAMAVVFVFVVVRQAEFDVSLDTVAGVGASSAPWSLMGGYVDGESDAGAADVFQLSTVSGWPIAEVNQGP